MGISLVCCNARAATAALNNATAPIDKGKSALSAYFQNNNNCTSNYHPQQSIMSVQTKYKSLQSTQPIPIFSAANPPTRIITIPSAAKAVTQARPQHISPKP